MLFKNNGLVDNTNEEVSTEAQALIMEAAMLDVLSEGELNAFLENHTEVNAALRDQVLLEKTIVRLDKKAKLSRAQKVAVFTVAKEKNDPKFKKLVTVWRLERFLEQYLFKKYGNEALRRAKKTMMNAGKSQSALVKKVAANVQSQLHSVGHKPAAPKK